MIILLSTFLCQVDITVRNVTNRHLPKGKKETWLVILFCLNLMQFYTFLVAILVCLALLRVFMEIFNDDEVDLTPGKLAATFIAFGKFPRV